MTPAPENGNGPGGTRSRPWSAPAARHVPQLAPGCRLGVGGASTDRTRQLLREHPSVLYNDGLLETRTDDLGDCMAASPTPSQISTLAPGEACDSMLTTLASQPADGHRRPLMVSAP